MDEFTVAAQMSRLSRIGLCALFASAFSVCAADRPFLSANLDSTGGILQLELSGATGTEYVIESSTNLSQWTEVFGGFLPNGTFSTQVSVVIGYEQFFRARENSAWTNIFPTNVVLTANTNLAVTMIVTTNGGSALFYGHDGTEFRFSVPAFTVPKAQLITLTALTNVGGLPFSGGLLGAVRLEPEGLDFWGAATLQMSLPTNADRRKVVSFGAKSDGSGFHLTPDRVTTNGVVIPITRLGVFGSALAELDELGTSGAQGQRALLSANQSNGGDGRMSAATSDDCFPERRERARQVERDLNESMQVMNQELALILSVVRQRQLVGVTEDTFDTGDVLEAGEDASCLFMQTQVQPHFLEATSNCELMKVLLVKVLGIERQRQLMGAGENPDCSSAFSALPLCAGMQNCLQEIELCCLGGRKGPSKITEIYALGRQDQLLGTSCLTQSAIDEAVDACSSNAWTGNIVFNANAETVETVSDARVTQVTVERYNAQFSGEVWESQEFIIPGFGGTVTLRLRGTISYDDYYNRTTDVNAECGVNKTIDEGRTVAATETWYRVDLNINADGTYGILAAHHDDRTGMPGAEGTDTDYMYSRVGRRIFTEEGSQCVSNVESSTRTDRTIALLPPMSVFNLRMSSTNSVGGSHTLEKFTDHPPTDGKYQWSFTRQRVE